jgi:hypothetical protein
MNGAAEDNERKALRDLESSPAARLFRPPAHMSKDIRVASGISGNFDIFPSDWRRNTK